MNQEGTQGQGAGHGGGRRYFRYRRRRRDFNQQQQPNRDPNSGQPRLPAAPPQRSEAEKIFMEKTPVDPHQWICLEKGSTDPSMRALDLLCPMQTFWNHLS